MTFRRRQRVFQWPWNLFRAGVLGMNERNLDLLAELNTGKARRNAGDKIVAKSICSSSGIAVPETLAIIDSFGCVDAIRTVAAKEVSFVLKPARGWGGGGVLVARNYGVGMWTSGGGTKISVGDLEDHTTAILAGTYSQGGGFDRALIEEFISVCPVLTDVSGCGSPDIRVLICRSVPVMAMLRLPTMASAGRANLHQGAAAAGIDLRSGRTVGGILGGCPAERHPDTGRPLPGITVPSFDVCVELAVKAADCLGLGYAGVDTMVRQDGSVVVLEVNAQPGLGIQLANRRGLLLAMGEAGLSTGH